MVNPLVSVIIPVYNMEAYIDRCLESVLANSYQYLEIICVDDGSKDNSLQIIQKYAEKDSRLIVISKENGGVSSARNAGLNRMTGEFVTFIDPDDFVHPQFFDFLISAQKKTDSDIVICYFNTVYEKDLPVQMNCGPFDESLILNIDKIRVFKNSSIGSFCWGKIFRTDFLKNTRFHEDILYAEDTIFNAEVWADNPDSHAVIINKAMYYYFFREDSLVRITPLAEQIKTASFFAESVRKTGNDDVFLDRAIKMCLDKRYLSTHIILDSKVCEESKRMLRALIIRLKKTKIYNLSEKTILSLFIRIPAAYWAYRSFSQPYMWKWEKVEKRKRREEKRSIKGDAIT